jgi:hypothetical protein
MRHREQLIDQKTSLTDKEKSLHEVEKILCSRFWFTGERE